MSPAAPTVPVAFALTPARHGWIALTVTAGEQADTIRCSDVYDPFAEIAAWVLALLHGRHGAVEIEEEGPATVIWIDREPGSPHGRLRVFEPGAGGVPEIVHVDAAVDVLQLARAWHEAFSAYVPAYDPAHWDNMRQDEGKPVERTLARIDLRWIEAGLKGERTIPWTPDPV